MQISEYIFIIIEKYFNLKALNRTSEIDVIKQLTKGKLTIDKFVFNFHI